MDRKDRPPETVPSELECVSYDIDQLVSDNITLRKELAETQRRAAALCDVAESYSSPEYEPAFKPIVKMQVFQAVKSLREVLKKCASDVV